MSFARRETLMSCPLLLQCAVGAHPNCSASRNFWILPDGVVGNSSTARQLLGTLNPASESRAYASSSPHVGGFPEWNRTTAPTCSPQCSSGTPSTATSLI